MTNASASNAPSDAVSVLPYATPAEYSVAVANKVAHVTLAFWVMKICATTLGETAGDLLAQTMHVGYLLSSLILISIFLVTLVFQLASKKFHPILYWAVILSTSTAGTTMSDFMDRSLDLGYTKGTLLIVSALISVLAAWRLVEGNLRVDNIRSRRAETFYWFAILVSNTLGTALGDFLADDSGLGFLGGALLIGSLIAVTALAYRFTKLNRVALFWIAFVLTRPFGATFGDLLTKPHEHGGLNFGTLGSSAVLMGILVIVIGFTYYWPRREISLSEPAAEATL